MQGQKLVIFDLDKTLTSENVSYEFGKYLYSKGVFSFFNLIVLLFTYALHALYLISSKLLHQISFYVLFYNKNARLIEKYVQDFLKEQKQNLFRQDVCLELHKHQQIGDLIFIMSTSPSFLVQPIAKLLCVDNVLATEYEEDGNGKYIRIKKIVDGNEKKRTLLQLCTNFAYRPEITVYSDSMRDFALFKICQNPVAVYPEKSLKRYAKNNNWRIIEKDT